MKVLCSVGLTVVKAVGVVMYGRSVAKGVKEQA